MKRDFCKYLQQWQICCTHCYQVAEELFHTEQHGLEGKCGYHNYIPFTEPKGSLTCSQEASTGPSSEQEESSSQLHHFNIILPSVPKYPKW
jgi:hypothetical protein